jgi:acetoin utilization deacetylase AcuC-like enzyme
MAAIVRNLADDLCQGRVAMVLEGGYAAAALREGTRAALEGLLSSETPPLPAPIDATPGSNLWRAVEQVVAVHGRRNPDLGAV